MNRRHRHGAEATEGGNPFRLFRGPQGSEQATREIHEAIASRSWSRVQRTMERWAYLGATDTASRDAAYQAFLRAGGEPSPLEDACCASRANPVGAARRRR